MRVIAFVTQKGGAGKSTLAASLAVAAREAGESVVIFDLDPLRSLVKWSDARENPRVPIQGVEPDQLARALRERAGDGATLAIIDTPGADSDCSDQAIRAADLCVIPVRPNAFDLWASEATLARVKASGKDYAFLLNQCPPARQSARIERGARALQEMGALLAPLITARVDYQNAARLGLGVSDVNPNGVAAQEMRDLWRSLEGRLQRAGAEAAAAKNAAASPQAEFARLACEAFAEALRMSNAYANLARTLFDPGDVAAASRPTAAAQTKADPARARS